jgi:ribosome biogenesis GTPase A
MLKMPRKLWGESELHLSNGGPLLINSFYYNCNYNLIMGGSFGKKKSKIIIVGLDNSGKSTMINMLKPKKVS